MMSPPDHRRGFTLIEAITAMVILSLAVPPMMWALREAHIQRVNPALVSTARWLAIEKLEDVIADRHSTTRGWDYLVAGNYGAEAQVTGFTGFSRSVVLNETGSDLQTAGEGFMTVTVTLGWTDAKLEARTMAISTVVTEYDTP